MTHVLYRDAAGRTGRRLLAEYLDSIERARAPLARRWREAQGWPRRAAIMGLGGGVARVEPSVDGTYQPVEGGGRAAILIPVWAGPTPGRADELLDLVAWIPADDQLLTRRGVADLVGEWAVWQAEHPLGDPRPLMIFSDPAAWASAAGPEDRGGHGAVLVDWSRAWQRLGHLPVLLAADIATGQRLRDAMVPPQLARPQILVARPSEDSAA